MTEEQIFEAFRILKKKGVKHFGIHAFLVSNTVGNDYYLGLEPWMELTGLAYRITPFTTTHDGKAIEGVKNFDTKRTYDNIMHRFKFGGIDQKGIYLDETVMRMCYTHRRIMAKLALELIDEQQDKKAEEVLRYTAKQIPSYNVRHNYTSGSMDMARAWSALGNKKEALTIMNDLWKNSAQYLRWYCTLDGYRFDSSQNDCAVQLYIMQQLIALADTFDEKWGDKRMKELNNLAELFESKGGNLGY